MARSSDRDSPSSAASERQRQAQHEEFRDAVRALLMRPLLASHHDDFGVVHRHAERLRDWFLRETGWMLEVDRDGARLFKRPADVTRPTRGFEGYDRRRYVLLCLACAVLERADPQITLKVLGDRLLVLAAEVAIEAPAFSFTLTTRPERSELVSVCRTLLALGVLVRVAGEEEAFVQSGGDLADALYDIRRGALAGMLAVVRGPSTWPVDEAPATLEERLAALVTEVVADSEEGRRTAQRHHLARRLLDDPVVYAAGLPAELRAYFVNQRGVMAARLCEATGLTAEIRAEGIALVDESGELSDVAMPAEGTEAHATLLVADFLARTLRRRRAAGAAADGVRIDDVVAFLRDAKREYGNYWRRSARVAGAETELAEIAVARLDRLDLVARGDDGTVTALPALARFDLGAPTFTGRAGKAKDQAGEDQVGNDHAGDDRVGDAPIDGMEAA